MGPAGLDEVRLQEVRAFEAKGTYDDAIDRLRSLTRGEATRLVDLKRRARLRWLLTLLADVQPETARELNDTWLQFQSEQAAAAGDRADGAPAGARLRLLEKREREMIDGLVRFLEPLLPA